MKMLSLATASSRALGTVLCVCLVFCLTSFRSVEADVDPVRDVNLLLAAVAEARAVMSEAGRQENKAAIDQAVANINALAAALSNTASQQAAADANVTMCAGKVQSAQNDLSQLLAQLEKEKAPLAEEARRATVLRDRWNAQYDGKSITVPEPWNSINAEKARIAAMFDALNAAGEALFQRYKGRQSSLEAAVRASQHDSQNAADVRDGLKRTLLAQSQQFAAATQELLGKLIGWVKESPIPPPDSNFYFKGGEALDQLMRAYSQKDPMASPEADRIYAPGIYNRGDDAKLHSNFVFDTPGPAGTLSIVTDKGNVPAPAEMQRNEAIAALLARKAAAQAAVEEARSRWSEIIHAPGSTPQQFHAADQVLIKAEANLGQIRYQERLAIGIPTVLKK